VIDIQKKTKPKAHFTPKFNLHIREGVGASETGLVVFPFSNQRTHYDGYYAHYANKHCVEGRLISLPENHHCLRKADFAKRDI
jgi:uncharacterized protein YigE (DUF2233 family)